MMPPSRCCTVRMLPSGLTTPDAMAAEERGAVAAQPPPMTKNAMTTANPTSAGFLRSRPSGGGGGSAVALLPVASWSCRGLPSVGCNFI